VTVIAGMAGFTVEFTGAPGHAGTVPMPGRSDAMVAAAEFCLAIRDAALAVPGAVATVGELRIQDAAANVIPGRVTLTLDLRAPSTEALAGLRSGVSTIAAMAAEAASCAAAVEATWHSHPSRLDDRVRTAIRGAAAAHGHRIAAVPSGAGHDAGTLAAAGVASGMLFVRSLNGGASHRPDELSGEGDVAKAIDVLTTTMETLAGG
jgi:allantoate deiminase